MVINPNTRSLMLYGLESTPVVFTHLLSQATPEMWDNRFDPKRFTLREVIAHLADWEAIWLERINKIRNEEGALLKGRDPDQLAKEHNYADLDLKDSLNRFKGGRSKLVETLNGLEAHEWSRTGQHNEFGTISIQDITQYAISHDCYHLRQVVEWTE